MSDLWDYDVDGEISEDEKDQSVNKEKRRDPASWLPTEKRLQLKRKYGRLLNNNSFGGGDGDYDLFPQKRKSKNGRDKEPKEMNSDDELMELTLGANKQQQDKKIGINNENNAQKRTKISLESDLLLVKVKKRLENPQQQREKSGEGGLAVEHLLSSDDNDNDGDDDTNSPTIKRRHRMIENCIVGDDNDVPGENAVGHSGEQQQDSQTAKIKFVIADKDGHELTMRMNKIDKMEKAFKAYRKQVVDSGWAPDGVDVKFIFDGRVIGEGDTPRSLDLEEDEKIEAHYK